MARGLPNIRRRASPGIPVHPHQFFHGGGFQSRIQVKLRTGHVRCIFHHRSPSCGFPPRPKPHRYSLSRDCGGRQLRPLCLSSKFRIGCLGKWKMKIPHGGLKCLLCHETMAGLTWHGCDPCRNLLGKAVLNLDSQLPNSWLLPLPCHNWKND